MRRHLDYSHSPIRGSDVEKWIKAFRDRHPRTPWAATLDELLADYRLRADTGLELSDNIDEAGELADSVAGQLLLHDPHDCD